VFSEIVEDFHLRRIFFLELLERNIGLWRCQDHQSQFFENSHRCFRIKCEMPIDNIFYEGKQRFRECADTCKRFFQLAVLQLKHCRHNDVISECQTFAFRQVGHNGVIDFDSSLELRDVIVIFIVDFRNESGGNAEERTLISTLFYQEVAFIEIEFL
jgi:hypothetical protein